MEHAGRLWRCKGLLIDCGPSAAAITNATLEASGRDWPEFPADYLLVDARGEKIESYRARVWSIEDELGTTLFAVEGQNLVQIDVRIVYGKEVEVARKMVLSDLTATDDVAARACARTALDRMGAAAAQEVQRGQARVAAIAGAVDDLDAGEEVRAAQRALQHRVTAYDDQIWASLLSALVRFVWLYDSAPCVEPALDAFVAACRRTAYDRTFRSEDKPAAEPPGLAWMTAKQATEASSIVKLLRELEGALEREADGQEWVDAMLGAANYTAAAQGVARARALLEGLLAQFPGSGG